MFLEEGNPRHLFWPRPVSAPGQIWPKNNNTKYFIPTKFHKSPSSSSGVEVENAKSLRTDGGRTVRYDNSSLEPSAQVSLEMSKIDAQGIKSWQTYNNRKIYFC